MAIEFHQFQCLADNFGVLAHDPVSGATASLDAPEAAPILAALQEKGWTLTDIWLTHHHFDHIGAVGDLKQSYPQARVVGARKDAARLPPLDLAVAEGDELLLAKAARRSSRLPAIRSAIWLIISPTIMSWLSATRFFRSAAAG